MRDRQHKPSADPAAEDLARMQFLDEAGVDSRIYAGARMIEAPGFELGHLAKRHLFAQAQVNLAKAKNWRPPHVPPERAIYAGDDVMSGEPVNLDIEDATGHILAVGSTKTGKNYGAYVLIRGFNEKGIGSDTYAQKGDEPKMVDLLPDCFWVPIQKEPTNDLAYDGERTPFWYATAEALAIPRNLRPESWPEIPPVLAEMWESSPNPCWLDLKKTLEWKGKQPGAREKFSTLAAAVGNYCVFLGERALVRVGYDIRDLHLNTVHGCVGADRINFETVIGHRFVREMFDALKRGHSRVLRRVIFIPEGLLVYDKAVEAALKGALSFPSRFFTMASSFGVCLIVALQHFRAASFYVTQNTGIIYVYRQDGPENALACADRLGLGREGAQQLMSLPNGVAYVRAPGWQKAVLIKIPRLHE